jgi:cob(I)alamin adenosyltransferase
VKIYTKTGDAGMTGLRGGRRVSKHLPKVAAYGDIDELNAVLGWSLALLPKTSPLRKPLARIQRELFHVGAVLSSENNHRDVRTFPKNFAVWMEKEIDRQEKSLPQLRHFILPGGSPAGASLHYARTVCRRAERSISALSKKDRPLGVLIYINRLSDYLFVAARTANKKARRSETKWLGLK